MTHPKDILATNVIPVDFGGADISYYAAMSVMKGLGVADGDMFERVKRMENEVLDDLGICLRSTPDELIWHCHRMRLIIAYMYQIAGAVDLPEHILDVLSDPSGVDMGQIEAMLPYPSIDPAKWTISHNGKSVTCDTLTEALRAASDLRTEAEAQEAMQRIVEAVDEGIEEAQEIDARAQTLDGLRQKLHDHWGEWLPIDASELVALEKTIAELRGEE